MDQKYKDLLLYAEKMKMWVPGTHNVYIYRLKVRYGIPCTVGIYRLDVVLAAETDTFAGQFVVHDIVYNEDGDSAFHHPGGSDAQYMLGVYRDDAYWFRVHQTI